MKIDKTKLDDVLVIQPKIFEDNRGYFYESFKKSIFEEAVGKTVNFVQDNQSKSSQGTLRGLHYQLLPKAQGKLVRVLNGEIFDVAVDIRSTSKNFGKWFGIILSESNKNSYGYLRVLLMVFLPCLKQQKLHTKQQTIMHQILRDLLFGLILK